MGPAGRCCNRTERRRHGLSLQVLHVTALRYNGAMTQKTTIVAAGNTTVPAFLALKAKGFEVRVDRSGMRHRWIAETVDLKLIADNPLTLLGLVVLAESHGENWQASDAEIKQFMSDYGEG
jgi:hypothetical protein